MLSVVTAAYNEPVIYVREYRPKPLLPIHDFSDALATRRINDLPNEHFGNRETPDNRVH